MRRKLPASERVRLVQIDEVPEMARVPAPARAEAGVVHFALALQAA